MSVFDELKKRASKKQENKKINNQESNSQPKTDDKQFINSAVRYVVVNAFDDENNFVKCNIIPFVTDFENGTFTNLITNKTFNRTQPDDKFLFDDISQEIGKQIQDASLEELTFKAVRPFKQNTVVKECQFDKLLIQSNLQKELKQKNGNSNAINYNDTCISQSNIIDFCNVAEKVLTRVKLQKQHAKKLEQDKKQKKQAHKQNKINEKTM